jgi:lysine-ketoglutarate reductase/saccharopine dehydrogenase-like protein (TIGR00300 family)
VKKQEIVLEGHLIDSDIMRRVLDAVVRQGCEFDIAELRVGRTNVDKSTARIIVKAQSAEQLQKTIALLTELGATLPDVQEAQTAPAPADGVLPDDFYATTNHPTFVYSAGQWLPVERMRMDCCIVLEASRALCKKMAFVKKGERVVVGSAGLRIEPPEKPRERSEIFGFMGSSASSEKPNYEMIQGVAAELKRIKKQNGRIVVVAGPAVVHTGAGDALAAMVAKGYVAALLSGNALAVHDAERALFGTALDCGAHGRGRANHLRAINEVRKAGSLENSVRNGTLKSGIMFECVKHNIPFVLAGSIRDDGPMPDVIADAVQAQKRMSEALEGADVVLMLASMLHSIAAGNLLPSSAKIISVDINPAVATKLADRGTQHALAIVSDVGLFLRELERLL